MNRNAIPSTRQIVPTIMYEIPRNEFLPPKSDVVESTTDFVPWNDSTSKATIKLEKVSKLTADF